MNSLDKIYQKTVDKKVEELFSLSTQNLFEISDYGQEFENVGDNKINIGWWKYQINRDLIHIVYKTSRKTFLFLHKQYISGVKVSRDKIEYLTKEEIGEYD